MRSFKVILKLTCTLAALLVSFVINNTRLEACRHVPKGYKDTVTEKTKEAFLFHDGKNAHLVIKTGLQASKALPSFMAWVIPLPSLPSHYEEVSADLFPELFKLTTPPPSYYEGTTFTGTKSMSKAEAPPSIIVHSRQIVGDYEIQPIEILSEDAGGELNVWLTRNGFRTVPVENQRYYLKKGAVFLTLKVKHLKGRITEIKPLHIIYKADRLSVPLKFSWNSGVFDLMFYTFTADSVAPGALHNYYVGNEASMAVKGADQAEKSPAFFKLAGNRSGYLTRFAGYGFNTPGRLVKTMDADPQLGISPVTRTTLPSRTRNLLMAAGAVLAAGIFFAFKRYQNKMRTESSSVNAHV